MWTRLDDMISSYLDGISIADLMEKPASAKKESGSKAAGKKKRISNPDSKRQLKNILKHLSINRNIMPYGRCSVFVALFAISSNLESSIPSSLRVVTRPSDLKNNSRRLLRYRDLFPVSHHIRIGAEYRTASCAGLNGLWSAMYFSHAKSDYRHSLTVSYPVLR